MEEENFLQEYQNLQQQYRIVVLQKESLKLQIAEIENALEETKKCQEDFVYKVVGNVMIKKKKEDVIKELEGNKEDFEIKIKNLENMEKFLEGKIKELEGKIRKGG